VAVLKVSAVCERERERERERHREELRERNIIVATQKSFINIDLVGVFLL